MHPPRLALLLMLTLPFQLSGCTCGGSEADAPEPAPVPAAEAAPAPSDDEDAHAASPPSEEQSTLQIERPEDGPPRINTEALRRDLERSLQQGADRQLRLAPEGSLQLRGPAVPPAPAPMELRLND